VAIARRGRLVYAQGFGLADENTGERVTASHLFRIASVSKPITSVAIFSLIEAGRLRLDDKIFASGGILHSEYGGRRAPYVEELTIEHLLTHTAGGWPNDGKDPMVSNAELDHRHIIT